MPWLETDVRDQRIRFVVAASHPTANVTATCRAFGISRKTGYKWLGRHAAAQSVSELADQSRRPHRSPTRTSERITHRVVALREAYGWGGEKLVALVGGRGPGGVEVYAARCALLHEYGIESKLTRASGVRRIGYFTGQKAPFVRTQSASPWLVMVS